YLTKIPKAGPAKPTHYVFYAEAIWSDPSRPRNDNALEMENQLADLADAVIIIVESPGTFAELGAFSSNPSLRKKMLPILSHEYKNIKDSFIATGPVQWIDKDSLFKPSLYANHSMILQAAPEIDERMKRIKPELSSSADF